MKGTNMREEQNTTTTQCHLCNETILLLDMHHHYARKHGDDIMKATKKLTNCEHDFKKKTEADKAWELTSTLLYVVPEEHRKETHKCTKCYKETSMTDQTPTNKKHVFDSETFPEQNREEHYCFRCNKHITATDGNGKLKCPHCSPATMDKETKLQLAELDEALDIIKDYVVGSKHVVKTDHYLQAANSMAHHLIILISHFLDNMEHLQSSPDYKQIHKDVKQANQRYLAWEKEKH